VKVSAAIQAAIKELLEAADSVDFCKTDVEVCAMLERCKPLQHFRKDTEIAMVALTK
jgi:hypothetical protein